MLGNVGSHSCTTIWLTALSFGLNPSKRHHDIGVAEFSGITEYIELRKSKHILELRGLLGIAEPTNTLEWLLPVEFRNSEAILFHPKGFGPGGSHGAVGRSGATSQADEEQGWTGMGGGNAYSHKATSQTNLDESPQHLARPLSTGRHTTLPPMGGPDRRSATYHNPSDK